MRGLTLHQQKAYHPIKYLNIFIPGKLESVFIEITCSKSSNIIVGFIYKHPSPQMNNFANDIILPLLEKLHKENSKKEFLNGDFNIDLQKMKHLHLPIILLTNCHPVFYPLSYCNQQDFNSTLIDNVFCNVTFTSNIISGNLTSTASDHLTQIAIIGDFFENSPNSK